MSFKRKSIQNGLVPILIVGLIVGTLILGFKLFFPGGWGIGTDVEKTKTIEKNPKGKITKISITTKTLSGKTVWDWLGVLGVPFTLALLGYCFQRLQERQGEKNRKEELIQSYFDNLSTLLIDKDLLACTEPKFREDNKMVSGLDVADIVRARTLSILRRLGDDGKQKTFIMKFLLETKILSVLKPSLSGAELNNVNLAGGNFQEIDFSEADLRKVQLSSKSTSLLYACFESANLTDANLSEAYADFAAFDKAKLIGTNFDGTSLMDAKLGSADVSKASFYNANLTHADLSNVRNWTEKQLSAALLCRTKLPDGCDLKPDRDCKKLQALNEALGIK